MKVQLLAYLVLITAALSYAPAQADKRVETELASALEDSGSARVTVLFDLGDAVTTGELSDAQRWTMNQLIGDEIVAVTGDDFQVHHRFNHVNAVVGTVDSAGLAKLLSLPSVRSVGLDPGGYGHLDVARVLMGIDTLQAPPPGGFGNTGQNVKVVVMDSGIDSDNADFTGALVDEACFCSAGGAGCCPAGGTSQFGSGAAEDDHGHGTWVSGHVLSRGNDGPRGAAPGASLVSVKVLDSNNSFCCASDVTAAYDWIATNHPDADVLNASLGTSARFGAECSASTTWLVAMSQATAAVRANGTLMTASSGNDEDTAGIGAPSCLGDVMAVGATYKQDYGSVSCTALQVNPRADDVACFSNVSPELEVLAPGAFMNTTALGGGTATGLSGTSFASPLVAGCAALMKSANPGLTAGEMRTRLIQTGVPVLDERVGVTYPRVDCLEAVLSGPLVFRNGFENE